MTTDIDAINERLSERRIKKMEHRTTGIAKDIHGERGLAKQVSKTDGRVEGLDAQVSMLWGRIQALEERLRGR